MHIDARDETLSHIFCFIIGSPPPRNISYLTYESCLKTVSELKTLCSDEKFIENPLFVAVFPLDWF